jgi:hypothetical protein
MAGTRRRNKLRKLRKHLEMQPGDRNAQNKLAELEREVGT